MPDVTIQRCTLRITRRGGWSWGPDPKVLVDRATAALPDLLGRQIERLAHANGDLTIDKPVRIRIRAALSELMDPESAAFRGRLATAVEKAWREQVVDAIPRPEPVEEAPQDDASTDPVTLFALLCGWYAEGVLDRLLRLLPPSVLEAWHRELLPASAASLRRSPKPQGPAAEAVHPRASNVEDLPARLDVQRTATWQNRASLLRERLHLAVRIASERNHDPADPVVLDLLDRELPLKPLGSKQPDVPTRSPEPGSSEKNAQQARSATPQVHEPSAEEAAPRASPQSTTQHRTRLRPNEEVSVSSALPFLMLGPLSRLGYLDTMSATFAAAGLSASMPLFATALAYKVLEPPERGWRRSSASISDAAVFAGLIDPAPEPALVDFAVAAADHLAPLDALLAVRTLEGHDPRYPFLLHKTGGARASGFLLVEREGLFPVAWIGHPDELKAVLEPGDGAVILVHRNSADPDLLGRLDALGYRFLTNAAPTRHESWTALARVAGQRWWTNDAGTPLAGIPPAALELDDAVERIDAMMSELFESRPCTPLAQTVALDASVTLAAATALGTIAWTLWRDVEPVDPLLALERFHDLDASVRFGRDSVLVRVSRGRRYLDLFENGLLRDVARVPWLGGRVLEFGGG